MLIERPYLKSGAHLIVVCNVACECIYFAFSSAKQKKEELRRRRRRVKGEMELQWMILSYIVAAEVVIVLMLTVPLPKFVKSRVVSLVSAILPPSVSIVRFAASQATGRPLSFLMIFFSLVGICWKNGHRLMCTGESCTASERDPYEISVSLLLLPRFFFVLVVFWVAFGCS